MAHETLHIGLIVIFGIIMLPVYAMVAGWLLGKPHDYRTVAMTFGYIGVYVVAIVVGLAVLGVAISLVVPY